MPSPNTQPVVAEPSREWHLDRRLQITHILGTLSLGIGAVLYVADFRKDVEVLKMQVAAQVERDKRQDEQSAASDRIVIDRLDKLDAKLDRLIESGRMNENRARPRN